VFHYGRELKPLMAATEGTLRLHRHEPGSLVREAKYLHQHTGRKNMSARSRGSGPDGPAVEDLADSLTVITSPAR
jgi:hypothetical protein